MVFQGNRELRSYSQELRKNMTGPERLLWAKVRMKQVEGCRFYRQKVIGNCIADFCCPKARLVIELDGSQHGMANGREADVVRDAYMASRGLKVLRFTDTEVLNDVDGVAESIRQNVKSYLHPVSFPPRGKEEIGA